MTEKKSDNETVQPETASEAQQLGRVDRPVLALEVFDEYREELTEKLRNSPTIASSLTRAQLVDKVNHFVEESIGARKSAEAMIEETFASPLINFLEKNIEARKAAKAKIQEGIKVDQERASKVKMICFAYEQGFGYGVNGRFDYNNPYRQDTDEAIAWGHGLKEGAAKRDKHLGEQAIPYEAALELFKLHLTDRLIKKGHSFGAANEILAKARTYDPEIDQMLRQICLDVLPHHNKKIKNASLSGAFYPDAFRGDSLKADNRHTLIGRGRFNVHLAGQQDEVLYTVEDDVTNFQQLIKKLTEVVNAGKWPFDVLPGTTLNDFVELWFDGDDGSRYFSWLKLGRSTPTGAVTIRPTRELACTDILAHRRRFLF